MATYQHPGNLQNMSAFLCCVQGTANIRDTGRDLPEINKGGGTHVRNPHVGAGVQWIGLTQHAGHPTSPACYSILQSYFLIGGGRKIRVIRSKL